MTRPKKFKIGICFSRIGMNDYHILKLQAQTKFVKLFEQEFQNILDVHIPQTPSAYYYTQANVKLHEQSSNVGNARLAKEINKLCNMITGEDQGVEKF